LFGGPSKPRYETVVTVAAGADVRFTLEKTRLRPALGIQSLRNDEEELILVAFVAVEKLLKDNTAHHCQFVLSPTMTPKTTYSDDPSRATEFDRLLHRKTAAHMYLRDGV
jgi:hypothetical protein